MNPINGQAPADDGPAFSGADAIKLQTATFLSLSAALSGAGVIRLADMATILSAHVRDADQEPWAHVVRAIVTVLSRDSAHLADQSIGEAHQPPVLTVLQGGAHKRVSPKGDFI